ncbi:MAG TPA: hypothetical protein VF898_05305 [Chloroflexota bacterium]
MTVRKPATSFIVRVWTDDSDAAEIRGEVELIRTGEKRMFTNRVALLALLDRWRQDLGAGP